MAQSHPRSTGAAAHAKGGGKKGLMVDARLGYAARGAVYIMVGVLAFLAAFNLGGGQTTGARGAIQAILDLPFGSILVGAVAIGLATFALWRLIAVAVDADRHGPGGKGIAIRAGMAFSGLIHGVLALYAGALVWGTSTASQVANGATGGGGGGGASGGGSGGYTAQRMAQPWGP